MAHFVATAFFRLIDSGWSESYFATDVDPLTVGTNFVTLMGLRALFLADNVNMVGFRISNDDISGDSYLIPAGMPIAGLWPARAIPPGDGFLVKYFSETGRHATRIFRGLPEDQWTPISELFTPTDPFKTAVGNFNIALFANWKIASLKDPPVGNKHSYLAILGATLGVLAHRNIGRPFGLRRGRRQVAL